MTWGGVPFASSNSWENQGCLQLAREQRRLPKICTNPGQVLRELQPPGARCPCPCALLRLELERPALWGMQVVAEQWRVDKAVELAVQGLGIRESRVYRVGLVRSAGGCGPVASGQGRRAGGAAGAHCGAAAVPRPTGTCVGCRRRCAGAHEAVSNNEISLKLPVLVKQPMRLWDSACYRRAGVRLQVHVRMSMQQP